MLRPLYPLLDGVEEMPADGMCLYHSVLFARDVAAWRGLEGFFCNVCLQWSLCACLHVCLGFVDCAFSLWGESGFNVFDIEVLT